MNTEVPEVLIQSAEKTSKIFQELLNAEKQASLWNSHLENLKKSHESAMRDHNFLISRWNIKENAIEQLHFLDEKI